MDGNGDGLAQVQIRAGTVPYDHNVSFMIATSDAGGYFSLATTPEAHELYFAGGTNLNNVPDVNVVDEYYSNKTTSGQADHVTVVEGETVNLGDVTLDVGAIVAGQVTKQSGTPLSFGSVQSCDLAGNSRDSTFTDVNGSDTLMRIPIGGAKIRFSKSNHALEERAEGLVPEADRRDPAPRSKICRSQSRCPLVSC